MTSAHQTRVLVQFVLSHLGRSRMTGWALFLALTSAAPSVFIVTSSRLVAAVSREQWPDARVAVVLVVAAYLIQHSLILSRGRLTHALAHRLEGVALEAVVSQSGTGGSDANDLLMTARLALDGRVAPTEMLNSLATIAITWGQGLLALGLLIDLGLYVPAALLATYWAYRRAVSADVRHFNEDARAAVAGYGTASHLRGLAMAESHRAEMKMLGADRWLPRRLSQELGAAVASVGTRKSGSTALAMTCLLCVTVLAAGLATHAAIASRDIGSLSQHIQALVLASNLATLRTGQMNIPESNRHWGAVRQLTNTGSQPVLRLDQALARIELSRVTFQYPSTESPAVDEVTLKLVAGRSYAIVGENGAGKSTLGRLLVKRLEPSKGTIAFVDGTGRHCDGEPLVAFLPQRPTRLPMRFGDAVTWRPRDAPRSECGLDHLAIDKDSWIGHGPGMRQLSGGQWQQVAIERTRTNEPAALVLLDEPTAPLDPEAEARFSASIPTWSRRRILVIISHRLSNVRNCDEILVMHAGRIVEAGSHAELMAARGRYWRMFEAQAAGYVNAHV